MKTVDILLKKLRLALAPYGAPAEFARKIGVSRAALDRWIDGGTVPLLSHLDSIAEALQTTPANLVSPFPLVSLTELESVRAEAMRIRLEMGENDRRATEAFQTLALKTLDEARWADGREALDTSARRILNRLIAILPKLTPEAQERLEALALVPLNDAEYRLIDQVIGDASRRLGQAALETLVIHPIHETKRNK